MKRTNKDFVEEMVKEKTSKLIRDFFDALIVTIIVVLVLAEVISTAYKAYEKQNVIKQEEKITKSIEDARWLNDKDEEWENLFKQGKYEDLVDAYEIGFQENNTASNWKRESFIYEYKRYIKANDAINAYLSEGNNHTVSKATELLYNSTNFAFGYDFLGTSSSQKEKDVIASCRKDIYEKTKSTLDLSDEEYENLAKELMGSSTVPSYSSCREHAEIMVGEK